MGHPVDPLGYGHPRFSLGFGRLTTPQIADRSWKDKQLVILS
jgi:hypothetical protein